MRPRRSAIRLVVAVLTLLSFVAPAAPSASANPALTQVSGLLTPDENGVCPADSPIPGAMVASGSLIGCWYLDTYNPVDSDRSAGLIAYGTEHFNGCLGDRCGTFNTTFTFTAKYGSDGAEIHGRCHHPIVGGSGGFAGATGVVNMHDLPNGCVAYKGHISS
jgi:hypothetical protein